MNKTLLKMAGVALAALLVAGSSWAQKTSPAARASGSARWASGRGLPH